MVKVRESQIPEESEKDLKVKKKVQYSFEDEDEEEVKRLNKTIIHFKEEGFTISAYDLHTIEKDMRFVEKPKAHWEWGITINKGLETSQYITKTDLSFWYMKEEVRDEKFSRMMELFEIEGLNVIEI